MILNPLFHWILEQRAEHLYRRVMPYLPSTGTVLDVGSATGHFLVTLEQHTSLRGTPVDVIDFHLTGLPPLILMADQLPFPDHHFDCTFLIFVLQYVPSPRHLLSEIRRVTRQKIIVIESTYKTAVEHALLKLREWVWGPLAFHTSRWGGFIPKETPCTVQPLRHFTREEIRRVLQTTGFREICLIPERWMGSHLSRDLIVLEAI
ncbi:MAG: methyltransferase domain-containing protein [Gemmatimonadetes bacterium]|nr:MAG: methyltransferase domain-containing protein [Gemmatimonadota bacterium]